MEDGTELTILTTITPRGPRVGAVSVTDKHGKAIPAPEKQEESDYPFVAFHRRVSQRRP
jgi:hypothetical protein